jgi:hypothetical protein
MDEFQSPPPGRPGATCPFRAPTARRAPPGVAQHARGLIRFVYTSNPFYVISAGLVFWGLRLSFDPGGGPCRTLALMAGLAGYTGLLAAAAWFLIRYGNVWEDVRTVLLMIVLMFLGISVTFEESLAANPRLGALYFLGGLAFAIVLSEGLLRGIRLWLPALFRIPYYLILALFFLYPIALSPVVNRPHHPALHWGLFGFCPVAGVLFLALLPAVRRGPRYVRENGSPWQWPWYPWVLFGVLGLGVCGRAYYLCMSLHPEHEPETVFGLYFLVPLLLAANVLLLEIGLVSHSKGVTRLALIVPAGLLVLAVTGPAAAADDLGFLERFTCTLGGSPLLLTLIATAVFYAVAMLRRVPHASEALTAALAAFSVCGPGTVDTRTLTGPWGLPLLLAAALQGWIGLRRRNSPRCLLAACCLVAAITLELRGTAFTACRGLIPAHLLLAAVLSLGAAFRGGFAGFLQYLGAAFLLLAGVGSVTCDPRLLGDPPPVLLAVYPAGAIVVAAAYGALVGNRWFLLAALGNLGYWLAVSGGRAYGHLRQTLLGLDHIAWGVLSFLVAMLISLTKAGMPQRWLARRRTGNDSHLSDAEC